MSSDDTTRDFDAGVALADPPAESAAEAIPGDDQANLDLLLDDASASAIVQWRSRIHDSTRDKVTGATTPITSLHAFSGLGVANAENRAPSGPVSKVIEVFDETGSSLGYVPVYPSVT